jgi:hypothetical protein
MRSPLESIFAFYEHGSWTLGKPYRIKQRCYHLEHRGEYIWEQFGNKRKKTKNLSPGPPTPQKEKKLYNSWVHAETSHWLHEISLTKTVHHHFSPGLPTFQELRYLIGDPGPEWTSTHHAPVPCSVHRMGCVSSSALVGVHHNPFVLVANHCTLFYFIFSRSWLVFPWTWPST